MPWPPTCRAFADGPSLPEDIDRHVPTRYVFLFIPPLHRLHGHIRQWVIHQLSHHPLRPFLQRDRLSLAQLRSDPAQVVDNGVGRHIRVGQGQLLDRHGDNLPLMAVTGATI